MSHLTRTIIRTALSGIFGAFALAGPAAADCKVARMPELRVTMAGSQPLVAARINGADARFLVDSGAFYSVITPVAAERYGLKLQGTFQPMEMVGVGGATKAARVVVKTFTLAGLPLREVTFFEGGSGIGDGVAGVLGQNVLGLADVEYDLANGSVRMIRSSGCDGRNMAYWAAAHPASTLEIVVPREEDPRTISVALVNGVRMKVMFDSGAGSSGMTVAAARRAGINLRGAGVEPGGSVAGFGPRQVASWIVPVDSFTLGDEQVLHTRIRVVDMETRNIDLPVDEIDMLIGADFFLSHHIYVSNQQKKMFFTFNGGPVFNLEVGRGSGSPATSAVASPSPDTARTPTDADGYGRRGAAFAARRDYGPAIADLSRAIALAPGEAEYPYQRGLAHLGAGQSDLAMADFDQALMLKPNDAPARLARARLHVAAHDKPAAIRDLEVAARSAPPEGELGLEIAGLFTMADDAPAAISQYDLWIRTHADDSAQIQALNGRCWARAIFNQDLDKALGDCNRSLRLSAQNPTTLDSRGLVHLRRGELDLAILDYDAVLAATPKSAWSLYGRGLARLRKGQTADGQADLKAATALRPQLPAEAAAHGIAP